MKQLLITQPKKYPIYISDHSDDIKTALNGIFEGAKKVAVITDNNVFEIYGRYFDGRIKDKDIYYCVLPAGERQKNVDNYLKIMTFLNENGFTRKDGVMTFGGGVTGDMAGFAASTYMRGVPYVIVPTTVLSMVDSSIGGKTAIDFNGIKNLIGAFYQPECVIINTSFCTTLNEREVKSGYGEIIKYAFLSENITEEMLAQNLNESLVYECLNIKKNIVGRDPFEAGDRKLLNLGHTFGHAIEQLSGFTLSHGECVVKGLYLTLRVSEKLNNIGSCEIEKAMRLIKCKGHDIYICYSFDDIKKALYSDKKYDGEKLSFVALDKELKPYITKMTVDELMSLAE